MHLQNFNEILQENHENKQSMEALQNFVEILELVHVFVENIQQNGGVLRFLCMSEKRDLKHFMIHLRAWKDSNSQPPDP